MYISSYIISYVSYIRTRKKIYTPYHTRIFLKIEDTYRILMMVKF